MSHSGDMPRQPLQSSGEDNNSHTHRLEDGAGGDKVDLTSLLLSRFDVLSKEIAGIRTELSNIRAENKELSIIINNNGSELKLIQNNMKDNFNKINKEIYNLNQENNKLKQQIEILRKQSFGNNQLIYRNTIKIANIPMIDKENLVEIITKLSNFIGFEFNTSFVDCIYRSRKRYPQSEPLIIVGFLRNMDKTRFLELGKNKGIIFATDICESFKKSPIYIGEYMSPWNLKLYFEAKQLKMKGNIEYVWFRNGKVLARQHATAPVNVILCPDDLKVFQAVDASNSEEVILSQTEEGAGTLNSRSSQVGRTSRTSKRKKKPSPLSPVTRNFRARSNSSCSQC